MSSACIEKRFLAILKGTVNDPTSFPPSSRSHGSHHWAFERLLSASLVPLTAAAFVTSGTNYPILDGLFGVGLIMHSHIGVCFLSSLSKTRWAKVVIQVRLYHRRLPTHPQIPYYWSDCKMGFENCHCCYTCWNLSVQYERCRCALVFFITFSFGLLINVIGLTELISRAWTA